MIKTVRISDLGEIITGNTPPRNKPEYYGKYTPFIKATDISEDKKYTYFPEEYYSEIGHQKYIKSLIPKGATCVVTIGSIGKKMTMAHCDCFINQAMNAIIANDKYDSEYIYYLLKYNVHKLKSLDSGTASGRENVSKSAFSNMELDVIVEIEAQRRIASILSAYDDLIEKNRKQIKLLEEAAQRLYKEWFVDLRFPGWETTEIVDGVPVGWRNSLIKDTIEYEIGGGWGEEEVKEQCEIPAFVIRGTDLYGVTHGDFLSVPYRFHKKSNLESRKLQNGDIIFEVSGGSKTEGVARTTRITAALLGQFSSPVMCASFCKLVRPKAVLSQLLYDHFVFLRASGKTSEYDKKSASSIVNYRWKDFLVQESVLIPSNEILVQYNQCANSIYEKIVTCSIIVEKAKATRDRLLPKLMSGELEV